MGEEFSRNTKNVIVLVTVLVISFLLLCMSVNKSMKLRRVVNESNNQNIVNNLEEAGYKVEGKCDDKVFVKTGLVIREIEIKE